MWLHHTPNFKSPLLECHFPLLVGVSTECALALYPLPERLHWDRKYCVVALILAWVTACLHLVLILFSLCTQHNWSPIVICLDVATLHLVFTLQHNHILMDCNVLHNFPISSPSPKTNKVYLSSSLCTTIDSMVACSYVNPAMMSGFKNAGDNACPLGNYCKNHNSFTTFPLWDQGYTFSWQCQHLDNFKIQTIETIKWYVLQLFLLRLL